MRIAPGSRGDATPARAARMFMPRRYCSLRRGRRRADGLRERAAGARRPRDRHAAGAGGFGRVGGQGVGAAQGGGVRGDDARGPGLGEGAGRGRDPGQRPGPGRPGRPRRRMRMRTWTRAGRRARRSKAPSGTRPSPDTGTPEPLWPAGAASAARPNPHEGLSRPAAGEGRPGASPPGQPDRCRVRRRSPMASARPRTSSTLPPGPPVPAAAGEHAGDQRRHIAGIPRALRRRVPGVLPRVIRRHRRAGAVPHGRVHPIEQLPRGNPRTPAIPRRPLA